MEKIEIAPGIALSRLIYGMWRLAEAEDISPSHVQAKIEACLAQGITSVDQADIYGGYQSEAILGGALRESPGLRDQLEIVTKCGIIVPMGRHAGARVKHYDTSRAHITASVEASLRAMATDRVDLLLIHRPDPFLDPEETGRCLEDLVASGKVRAVGVSNFRPWDVELLQSAMQLPLVSNQIEISLGHLDPLTNGDIAFHQRLRQPLMAWSPLAGGTLLSTAPEPLRKALKQMAEAQGVDWSAVALAWLLRHPARLLPVFGSSDLGRIHRMSDAVRVEMDRQSWFELYTHALGHEVA